MRWLELGTHKETEANFRNVLIGWLTKAETWLYTEALGFDFLLPIELV